LLYYFSAVNTTVILLTGERKRLQSNGDPDCSTFHWL